MYRAADPRTVPTEVGTVYVLHFAGGVVGDPSRKSQYAAHYIGWASDWEARVEAHRKGQGGKLTAHAVKIGLTLEVAALHHGVTRDFERRLKNRGGGDRVCPICIQALKDKQAAHDAAVEARRKARAGRRVAA